MPLRRRVVPAVVERKPHGHTVETKKIKGWAWQELKMVDQTQGGAPVEQRQALQLLAVFIQHTDSKPVQQRLVCLSHGDADDAATGEGLCASPFMLLNDVGQTFGRANFLNRDNVSSVNFDGWWPECGTTVVRREHLVVGPAPWASENQRAWPRVSRGASRAADRSSCAICSRSRASSCAAASPGGGRPPPSTSGSRRSDEARRDHELRRCGA
jgi:hypothetical protein